MISVELQPYPYNSSIEWESSNSRIADVVDAGSYAYITAGEKTGTAKITVEVTDNSTDKTYKATCSVTVSATGGDKPVSNDEATYDPSMKVSMNAAYTGTEVSDSIYKEFHDVFAISLPDNASVRFSSINTSYGRLTLPGGDFAKETAVIRTPI